MPIDYIDKININGVLYDIKDTNITIDSTYDADTDTVTLTVGSLVDADNTEY